ncbi:MAG: hypothetical protein BGO70_07540 [Bacteroidetes bacterium 43-93]|jgi:acyl carrier protein|nr:acyl carrier protein [Bacteroidota bacterium]OJW97632.1 MAG: hypothetical protein BGO70_07540 [Bacteroidetes bacterium 43-93]
MDKSLVLQEINKICQRVFRNESLTVTEDTTAKDVDGWDSISNLFLIDELEKNFNMKFELDDILNAQNIGDLATVISNKA